MKKSMHHFRGFTGPDNSIEESLRCYGLAWRKAANGEYTFVMGIRSDDDGNYTHFVYFNMNKADFLEKCHESWFNLKGFLSFIDQEIIEPENWLCYVKSAVQYHGYENIFGSVYCEGFQIA